MITAQVEEFSRAVIDEIIPLVPKQYIEVSQHYKHHIPVNVNWNFYLTKQINGELIFVALREYGGLIGYFVGFINPCLHYQAMTISLDTIYVNPDSRGNKGGKLIIDCIEKEFKRRKVKLWKMGYKKEHEKYLRALLIDCGFSDFEVTLAKWAD
jgi:GNAT superfamily N-acetyltransferase